MTQKFPITWANVSDYIQLYTYLGLVLLLLMMDNDSIILMRWISKVLVPSRRLDLKLYKPSDPRLIFF